VRRPLLLFVALTACASHEAKPATVQIAPPATTETPAPQVDVAPDAASSDPLPQQGVTTYTMGDDAPQAPCVECTMVSGRLVPEVVVRIIHLNRGRFRFCYSNALRKSPRLSGRIAIHFTISRTGEVVGASVVNGSTIDDTDFRACLVDAFGKLSFPQPEGGLVDVTYPMFFAPKR
jgi:TonB family protein